MIIYIFYIFRILQSVFTVIQAMKTLVLMKRLCIFQSRTFTDLIYGSNLKFVEYRQIQIVVQNANNWSTKAAYPVQCAVRVDLRRISHDCNAGYQAEKQTNYCWLFFCGVYIRVASTLLEILNEFIKIYGPALD